MIKIFQVAYSISDHRKTSLILESEYSYIRTSTSSLVRAWIQVASLHESSGWILAKPAGRRLISSRYVRSSQVTRWDSSSIVRTLGCPSPRPLPLSDVWTWKQNVSPDLSPYEVRSKISLSPRTWHEIEFIIDHRPLLDNSPVPLIQEHDVT